MYLFDNLKKNLSSFFHSPNSILSTIRDYPVNNTEEMHYVGEGQFGIVYTTFTKELGTIAYKKFKIPEKGNKHEIKLQLMMVGCPFILPIYGIFVKDDIIHGIAMEYMPEGTLAKYTEGKSREELSAIKSLTFSYQIAAAVSYLHKFGVIHRDLKTENVLINGTIAKVCDFGLSRQLSAKMTKGVGTPTYTAPEVLQGSSYDFKADVYSYAYLLWHLMYLRKPMYNNINSVQDLLDLVQSGFRLECEEQANILDQLIEIVNQCWATKPSVRPTMENVLDNLYFMMKRNMNEGLHLR